MVLHRYNLYLSKGDVASYSKAGKTLLAFLFRDFYYRQEVKGQLIQLLAQCVCTCGQTLQYTMFDSLLLIVYMLVDMTLLKRLKVKLGTDPEKGKTSSEVKREEKEIEALLTVDEWYKTFVTTCKGMLSLGPSNHSTIIHLIYCACLAKKFSAANELNKVS